MLQSRFVHIFLPRPSAYTNIEQDPILYYQYRMKTI